MLKLTACNCSNPTNYNMSTIIFMKDVWPSEAKVKLKVTSFPVNVKAHATYWVKENDMRGKNITKRFFSHMN